MKVILEAKVPLLPHERQIIRDSIPILLRFDAEHFCFGRYGKKRITQASECQEEIQRMLYIAKDEEIEVDKDDIKFIKVNLPDAMHFFYTFKEREYRNTEPIDMGQLKRHFQVIVVCYNQLVYKWYSQLKECQDLANSNNDYQKSQSKSMAEYCQAQIDFFSHHLDQLKKVLGGHYYNEQDMNDLLDVLDDGSRIFQVVESNNKFLDESSNKFLE